MSTTIIIRRMRGAFQQEAADLYPQRFANFSEGLHRPGSLVWGVVFFALFALINRDRHRYGGYFIHLGMVVLGLGVVGFAAVGVAIQAAGFAATFLGAALLALAATGMLLGMRVGKTGG